MTANHKKSHHKFANLSKRVPLIALGGLVVAVLLAQAASAAITHIMFEAEAGTLSSNVSPIADTTASGGSAIRFATAITGMPPGPGEPGFQTNCINLPSACGYPDETNTGVLPGVARTNSSGIINVTTNGTVIENRNHSGQIFVRASNVTIRNVRLTSGDWYPIDYDGPHTNLVIEDTEIVGTGTAPTACVSFRNYTLRRVNCSGAADGFKADSNVVIEDSYVHNLKETPGSHNDGVQSAGGGNVIVRHSTFKLGNCACEIMQIGNETGGGNNNWLVEYNFFDGGGWVFNTGPPAQTTNWLIRNNRFTRAHSFGVGDVPSAIWTGNYYDNNGAAIK